MRCLYGHSDLVADFVGKMLGAERGFGPCRATGVIDASGRLVAGVVYNDWDDKAGVIQMSAASINPKWLTRRILCELMAYPFFQLGCQMVVFRTQPENRRTRKLVTGMGAVEYEIPRLGGRDKSEVLMCLTDDAWIASPYMKRSNVLPASGADIVDGRRLDPVSGGDADDGLASLPAAANVKDRGGVKPGASVGLALAGLCLVVGASLFAHVPQIVRLGAEEQVLGIDASGIVASMQNAETFGDFSVILHPDKSVRELLFPVSEVADTNEAIPLVVLAGSPKPAATGAASINLRPEAGVQHRVTDTPFQG